MTKPRLARAWEDEDLLTPAEVARVFRVDPKTVTRWARAGRLPSMKTPGGHRRYRYGDIKPLVQFVTEQPPEPA